MSATDDRTTRRALHPIHAVLLAGTIPLFLGALLSDIAYSSSFEIQWNNFASWLIAGGLVLAGLALLWAVVDLFRRDHSGARTLAYLLVLLAGWGLGFINALVHARDAWASMPTGLMLSVLVAILVCVAVAMGFSRRYGGDAA